MGNSRVRYRFNYSKKDYENIMREIILTDNEKEFFKLLVRGCACKEIANELNCSEKTVKNRRKKIYDKLNGIFPLPVEKTLPEIKIKIYLLIFPNGKVYIGKAYDTKKRWNNGEGYKQNKEMYADIQKYGWENIEKKILYNNLTIEQAKEKENETIVIYKSYMPEYGYNKQIISS